uniref:Uncharacterized protein n=1 Tax=Arundo donax TaxID=35708 RepID=A0A0A9AC55_ARUDO
MQAVLLLRSSRKSWRSLALDPLLFSFQVLHLMS